MKTTATVMIIAHTAIQFTSCSSVGALKNEGYHEDIVK